jgi:pilus assembly protein FimV
MSRKLILLGMLSLVILAPGAALSLGLGDIRLNSYLNQPMNAEIALSIASADELETLKVELASAEAFDRYGLDRPAYLSDLRFDIRRSGPAGAVIDVRSSRPIAEPFVTFLVEARWSGGRMLREYTVLLDPPVFLPAPEPEAEAAAAAAEPAAAVESPRPAPATRPVPAPSPVAAPTAARGEYGADFGPVQRNDTLWAIAQRVRPDASLSTNQVMVALFRANPQAFDGNINRLRAGAILRVPSRDEIVATSSGEATAEVRRHNEDWRAAAPPPPVERRLELAPPSETVQPTAPVSAPVSATAGAPELADAVQQLRSELADTRRLMEIKDAEIAALQSRLAELETETGIPVRPLPTEPLTPPEAVEPDAGVAPEPGEVAPAPVPEAEEPARVPPVAPPAPSMVDRALGLLGNLWLWLVLAAALIAGAVFLFLRKRGDDERSIEEDLAVTGTWGALDQSGKAAAAVRTAPVLARTARPDDLESILVEESERPAARPAPMVPPPPVPGPELRADEDYQYPFEDTIAGETGINLDQTDPMAEADFHMAYGLYDQAAEIIKKAVEREPDRYDLRRKLLDICFVWGNADEFLAQAKAVREIGGDSQAGDWAKVAIMGRQICPGEPMFAAGAAASVDVEVGEAESETTGIGADIGSSGEWLDFDVGESGAGAEPSVTLGDTREHPGPRAAGRPIEQTAELDLEELGIDLDLGETGEHALRDLADRAPDFPDEMFDGPAAGGEGDDRRHTGTIRLSEPPELSEEGTEADDDGGTLMMQAPRLSLGDDSTQQGEGLDLDLAEDDPTLSGLNRLDEQGPGEDTQLLRQSRTFVEDEETLSGVSGFDGTVADDAEKVREDEDRTFIAKSEASDDSPTSELGALEGDLDLDLDALTQVLESDLKARESQDIDATQMATGLYRATGGDDDATQMAPQLDLDRIRGTEEGDTREMPAAEMNEVGTKLDLARAYMDMGDPEGARSILEEVVDEGDEAQRAEARELLDSLD